ncbi:hypothetical protein [Neorhizobium galegae]|uniref:hypothetical protein n=1 Tax=Neorhizobium galegae TaxID=399 RepID=UPI0012FEB894|nr:hypothetical protein [Neorhizobium galegae]
MLHFTKGGVGHNWQLHFSPESIEPLEIQAPAMTDPIECYPSASASFFLAGFKATDEAAAATAAMGATTAAPPLPGISAIILSAIPGMFPSLIAA